MSRKKKKEGSQSTRQLMGIEDIKDYCIATRMGDLVFFIIKPTNISVLPDSGVAINSKESFEDNKRFYAGRMEAEELPALRRLLEQDSSHLDRIQALMASAREFYIIVRLRNEKVSEIFPYLSRIEKTIKDNGFSVSRAGEQEIKRMLGIYFEQDVTTEQYEDYDGDRWVIVGE